MKAADSPTPPAQPARPAGAMTAEEFIEQVLVGPDDDAEFFLVRVKGKVIGDVEFFAKHLNERAAAARQTWEAERAVLVTEAASAAAKVREMEGRLDGERHRILHEICYDCSRGYPIVIQKTGSYKGLEMHESMDGRAWNFCKAPALRKLTEKAP